jgi:hypothetical protein
MPTSKAPTYGGATTKDKKRYFLKRWNLKRLPEATSNDGLITTAFQPKSRDLRSQSDLRKSS